MQFDQYLRPSGFRMSDGANTLWGNGAFAAGTYAYDGAGNIKSIAEPSGITDTFKYDLLSRLTKADVYKGADLHIYEYAYDPYGNLTQRTEDPQGQASVLAYLLSRGIASGEAQAYIGEVMFIATIGPSTGAKNNRLNVVTRGGTIDGIATGITQSAATMVYDANGNLTDDGQYVYKYDCLNRQVAVYLPGGSTLKEQYFYDSAGERVAAVESTGTTLLTFRQFVRDGAAVLYEKKWDRSGSTWVAASDKLYVYAGGRMAATKETGASTTYTYYAVDHLGTVRYSRTLNSNGTLVTGGAVTYKAEPFGVMIPGVTASPNGNTHFYTGHERDTLPSGFNQDYMQFRYYGAGMGRFFKPDSQFDGTPGNPQGWNLYTYVKGNPVNFNDPTGHMRNIPDASAHSWAFLQPDPFYSKDFAQPYRMMAVGVEDPNSTNVTVAGESSPPPPHLPEEAASHSSIMAALSAPDSPCDDTLKPGSPVPTGPNVQVVGMVVMLFRPLGMDQAQNTHGPGRGAVYQKAAKAGGLLLQNLLKGAQAAKNFKEGLKLAGANGSDIGIVTALLFRTTECGDSLYSARPMTSASLNSGTKLRDAFTDCIAVQLPHWERMPAGFTYTGPANAIDLGGRP